MKNILYTIILSFLFSSSVFADFEAGIDAFLAGDSETAIKEFKVDAEGKIGVLSKFKELLKGEVSLHFESVNKEQLIPIIDRIDIEHP